MLEQWMTALNFAVRQKTAMYEALDLLKKLLTFRIPFKSILASMLTVFELFSAAVLDTPIHPYKDPVDLTGYELVFEDEFEGDSLNLDVWEPRGLGPTNSAFLSMSQVSVKDGKLFINAGYKENGEYGPGWYTGDIMLKQQYLRGYFEIKCKVIENMSNPHDMWSAFWLCNNGAYDADISKGGVGACEMDIMESFSSDPSRGTKPTGVIHAIWCNGVDDNDDQVDGRNLGTYYANDPCEEFNTYGFMWTEDEYVWYVNGIETARTSYVNGVCQTPESVIVSVATPAYEITKDHSISDDYEVEYVRVYQLAG